MHLPSTLRPLFDGLPRHVDVAAPTVLEAIAELDRRWPGLRDRLCAEGPSLRPHIHVKGGDYTADALTEADAVREVGARTEILPLVDGRSTSNVIRKIATLAASGVMGVIP